MKKLIITMISICLAAVLFVGCGGNTDADPTAAPSKAPAKDQGPRTTKTSRQGEKPSLY